MTDRSYLLFVDCFIVAPGRFCYTFLKVNRDGQQTQLRQEMDRLADIIVSVLRSGVSEQNIIVERKATPGRPF